MSSFHKYYVEPLELSPNELLPLPAESESARLEESKRLTMLLDKESSFSFVRLGDMDLTLLLAYQDKVYVADEKSTLQIDGTSASGSPGIGLKHADRLWKSFTEASYVDFHELLQINEILLPNLKLHRSELLYRNPTKETSYILPAWMKYEFKKFCENPDHRIAIAGAEASLLEWLKEQNIFKEKAREYWPVNSNMFFHQVRDNGRNIDVNLDLIKNDLKKFILKHKINTLFLSLGGGAKILCYELAKEHEICVIDFGAITRALCDLGSDGQAFRRSTHVILFYRLPFELVMDGIEATQPYLKPEELLAKAHAQLIHQLTSDRFNISTASVIHNWDKLSRDRFHKALKIFYSRYKKLIRCNNNTRTETKRFLHFCGKHRLTIRGILFYWWFSFKSLLVKVLQLFQKLTF